MAIFAIPKYRAVAKVTAAVAINMVVAPADCQIAPAIVLANKVARQLKPAIVPIPVAVCLAGVDAYPGLRNTFGAGGIKSVQVK